MRFGRFSWCTDPGTHVHYSKTHKYTAIQHSTGTHTSKQTLKEWWLFASKLRNNMRKSSSSTLELNDLQTAAAWICTGCRRKHESINNFHRLKDPLFYCALTRSSGGDGDQWSWWGGWMDIYGSMRMTQQKVCRLCVLLHTSVCEKPCLRKMQAGPTMLCSMLQFFTSVPKGLLNSSSSTSWSSPASTAFIFPSTTPFRGRQCYFHH